MPTTFYQSGCFLFTKKSILQTVYKSFKRKNIKIPIYTKQKNHFRKSICCYTCDLTLKWNIQHCSATYFVSVSIIQFQWLVCSSIYFCNKIVFPEYIHKGEFLQGVGSCHITEKAIFHPPLWWIRFPFKYVYAVQGQIDNRLPIDFYPIFLRNSQHFWN